MIAEKKGLCRVLFLLYWGKMSSNYREGLVKALIKFYEGGIEAHRMNIQVLLGSHVGLAEHKQDIERTAKMKAKLRGTPATESDIKFVGQGYLSGDNVSNIAQRIYRSPAFVKAIIERIGVPMKLPESDYEGIRNAMLPEQCVAESFEVGEIVWAIRKNYPAKIVREINVQHQVENAGYACQGDPKKAVNYEEKYGAKMYLIYTIETTDLSNTFFPHLSYAGSYCTQLAYDLGSLRHLEKYGVDIYNI